eukprot:451003-Rhodomonas_salina.2
MPFCRVVWDRRWPRGLGWAGRWWVSLELGGRDEAKCFCRIKGPQGSAIVCNPSVSELRPILLCLLETVQTCVPTESPCTLRHSDSRETCPGEIAA